jgi:hypothetical protein
MLLTFFVALISMKLKMAISPILFITCSHSQPIHFLLVKCECTKSIFCKI